MVMLLNSIALWRQQLKPDARVHGFVLDGGTAANIIPARTVGRFMVRSRSQADFEAMEDRFAELVQAAAAATGCTGEAVFSGRSSTMRHNRVLGDLFAANLTANGLAEDPPDDVLGSSDMGNVSHVLPTIHPAIAICERGVPRHSVEFRDAAATAARRRRRDRVGDGHRADRIRPVRRPVTGRGGVAGVPEVPVSASDDRPRARMYSAVSPRATAGIGRYPAFEDFDLPEYVGPMSFQKLPWVTDPDEIRRRGARRRDRRRAVRRRRQPPAGRTVRAAGDPPGELRDGLAELAPARASSRSTS